MLLSSDWLDLDTLQIISGPINLSTNCTTPSLFSSPPST